MAAPEGNRYWELRLRSGLKRSVEEPDYFLQKAIEYFNNIEENPFHELDFRGKDATKVVLPKMRMPTKEDYALFCGFSEWKNINTYRDVSEDFAQVLTRVERAIETYQLQAASAGMVKENIVSRLLHLAEKTDNTHKLRLGTAYQDEYED